MFNQSGAIAFDALLENSQFKTSIAEMNRGISGLTRSVQKESKEIDNTFKNLGRAAASYFAFSELAGLPTKLIQVRGEFQQLETAFTTMLGSKSKADALFKDVVRFAAATPFDLKGVAGASKQLLAYGIASEEVVGTLRRLGDVASGLNIPLNELTELYGKTKTNGRLFAEDLNQYVGRGIPMIALLAGQFKVAESEVRGLVEQGKVGFPEIERAINKLTDAGGTFAGLMEANSKSLTGLYSNFEDSVEQMFNKIGQSQEGLLGDSIRFATEVVDNYEPILDALKVIIATYGTYKAAVIATAAVQAAATKGGAVMAWLELATTIRSAKDAQIAFNLATKANPYAIAASALIALVTAVALFRDETNETTKAQERAIQVSQQLDQQKAEETTKIQILTKQISDETKTRDERNVKLKELIALSPAHFKALTIDSVATTKGADAIRDYTKALEKKLKVQASEEQIVGNNKRVQEIKSGALDEEFKPSVVDRAKFFLQDSGFDEKLFKKETERRKKVAIAALEEQNQELLKVAAGGADDLAKVPPVPKAKVPKAETEKIAKEEKEIRIKTFQEEITEKKELYNLYQRWIDSFGKEAADKQFADLISKNKDYVSFLNSKLAEIDDAKNYKGFGGEDAKNVDFVIAEKTEATGGKSAIDQYKEKLVETQQEVGTLTEYLVYLKKTQESLNTLAPSALVQDQKKAVAEATLATEKALKTQLDQYLLNVAGSEAKRLEIQNHYTDLRKQLDKQYVDDRGAEYQRALAQMGQDEEAEYENQKDRLHEQSKEFKALSKVIVETGRDGLKTRIGREQDELLNIQKIYGENSEQYRAQVQLIQKLNKELADAGLQNFAAWNSMVGMLADSLSEIPGAVGKIGSALSGLTSGLGNMTKAMERTEDGKVSMGGYAAAAQGAATLIGIVTSAAKQRKEAEQAYYESVIGQQTEYNLLLNEQIGLQSDLTKSIFYTDFEKVIDSGIKKMDDAGENFEKSLADLANGKAKNGNKNGVDWKAVGAGAAAGATIGGIAGAGVFSWATAAIGAVGGAIVGLIGGLKKKDTFSPILEMWPTLIDESKEGIESFNVELAKTLISNNLVDSATKNTLETTIKWVEQYKEAQEQIKGVIADLAGALGNDLRDGLVNAFQEGTSAAEAFGKSVNSIMENILEQMIFSKVLGPALDQLEKEMTASTAQGGDGNWMDDIGRFLAKGSVLGEQLFTTMEEAQKLGSNLGFDLWAKDVKNTGKGPQQGAITGASQESISVLEGQMTASRILTAEIKVLHVQQVDLSRSALFELSAINRNTQELFYMRQDLSEIRRALNYDWLRSIGGG